MAIKYRFLHLSAKCLLAAGAVSVTVLLSVTVYLGIIRGYRTVTLTLLAFVLPSLILVFCAGFVGTTLRFYRYEVPNSQHRCAVISYFVLSIFACIGAIASTSVSAYLISWGISKDQDRCFTLIPLTLSSIVDIVIAIWAVVCCCQLGLCSSDEQTTPNMQVNQAFYVIDQATGNARYLIFPTGSQGEGVAGTRQIAYFMNKPEDYWSPVLPTLHSDPPPAYEEHDGQLSSVVSDGPIPSPPSYEREPPVHNLTVGATQPSDICGEEQEPDNQTTHL